MGQMLARFDWPDLLTENFPSLKKLIPSRPPARKPHKSFVFSLLRAITSTFLKKKMTTSLGCDCPLIDSRDIYWMSFRYELFRRNFKQPWIDFVFTSTVSRKKLLNKSSINATLLPVGYHRSWGYNMSLERDVDVLFLGHLHKKRGRRVKILNNLKDSLKANGYELMIVSNDCFGQERTKLLNRTKILIDVVRMPWEIPGMRLMMAMSCGAMVISTGFKGDPFPYILNKHFVDVDMEQLAEAIVYYLQNDSERCKIAQEAQQFVNEQLTLENNLKIAVETIFQP
jgi:glycosyltransferase involved in cell wall biosynthesis